MAHLVHFSKEELTERFTFDSKLKRNVLIVLILGLVLAAIGAWFAGGRLPHGHGAHGDHHGHEITWLTHLISNFLLHNIYFFTLAMGGFFFFMVQKLAAGGWQIAVQRIGEAISTYLLFAIIGFVALFFLMDSVYEWVWLHEGADHLIDTKRAYLNRPFFIARNSVVFIVWLLVAKRFRDLSLKEDIEGGLSTSKKRTTIAVFFIIFFALSYTMFSIDWIKSLEPHWFSTIFGVYIFAGSVQSGLAVTLLILAFLKSRGYMKYTNDAHYHDLAKYMFGFSVFWAYIWVSQFLLIWYANIPEETFYFAERYRVHSDGYMGYQFFFFINVILNFVIPFLGLMTRDAKRIPRRFIPICFIILLGHWNDLYLMIMPGTVGANWGVGLLEIGMYLTFAGIFLYVVFTSLTKANLVPKENPYLEESLNHETGPV